LYLCSQNGKNMGNTTGNSTAYWLALACLMAGAAMYALCRIDIVFIQFLGLDSLPHLSLNIRNPLVYWLVYCLPDGLWYLALLLVQYRMFRKDSFLSRCCLYMAALLPFVIEGLQALHWISGTFDWWDIATYLFTLILFVLCVRKDFF